MSTIYHKGLQALLGASDAEAVVLRIALIRSTHNYTEDPDHDFVDDVITEAADEISVASYTRKTLANVTVVRDTSGDVVGIDFDDPVWTTLESGQTIAGYLIYIQVGGDDTTPENDILICYYNGVMRLTCAMAADSSATTVRVDKLINAIPTGKSMTWSGGATCSTDGSASIGARTITCTALSAGVAADEYADVSVDDVLPAATANGSFTIVIPANGMLKVDGGVRARA